VSPGAGGGGYCGGGAGTGVDGTGGGGGSGFISPSALPMPVAVAEPGKGATPPEQTNPLYATGVAVGGPGAPAGGSAMSGGPGRVVISLAP
jgi:hypothetical protein